MNIEIISTQGEAQTIAFSGKTWGELKQQLKEKNYNMDALRGTGRYSRNTYESKDAKIQQEDTAIFLTPAKADSGC